MYAYNTRRRGCGGIGIENYNDVKVGDKIEVFERTETARKI